MPRKDQRYFLFYYDPADDIVYIGAFSKGMRVYRGEIGYREFANKRIASITLHIDDDGHLTSGNGAYHRYDHDGFIDEAFKHETFKETLKFAPNWGGEKPDAITKRRIDVNRFRLSWKESPSVTQRVVNYVLNGEMPDSVRTSRTMTQVTRAT